MFTWKSRYITRYSEHSMQAGYLLHCSVGVVKPTVMVGQHISCANTTPQSHPTITICAWPGQRACCPYRKIPRIACHIPEGRIQADLKSQALKGRSLRPEQTTKESIENHPTPPWSSTHLLTTSSRYMSSPHSYHSVAPGGRMWSSSTSKLRWCQRVTRLREMQSPLKIVVFMKPSLFGLLMWGCSSHQYCPAPLDPKLYGTSGKFWTFTLQIFSNCSGSV